MANGGGIPHYISRLPAVSPIFMSDRKEDGSPEIELVINLIRGVLEKSNIMFGV